MYCIDWSGSWNLNVGRIRSKRRYAMYRRFDMYSECGVVETNELSWIGLGFVAHFSRTKWSRADDRYSVGVSSV